ncbi:MAG: Carboxylesterase [Thermotoga sp. 50_1627]|uniref:alpha/beta hydrolase n=1 Tax=Pseudothermotoga sp. TaxID=2033661 RepID=UPI00076CDBD3|nr:MAG: Carboxylesterase [Thermotoga sp. 50_64]KUK25177.1 MAG: Carboxylesterase [Thermotoga sp. 50_1627]MBC7116867.1 alpha/beta fold hydrolase [Pseudothermotoga sp.]MDK2923642.1 carboxylesterase [Pseudothermotoga sp.]HBT39376.1 esterase [Pseudothermotoga sp.]
MRFVDCKTASCSLPVFEVNGEVGVLFVHGFTGSPHDFTYMSQRVLNAGFSVSVPRLPGHGTCGEDFLTTTAHDWLRRAFDAYYDLRSVCKDVYIVGLSMGGVIAIIMASVLRPRKLVTLAAATHLYSNRIRLARLVGLFKDKLPKQKTQTYEDPAMETLNKEYWSYDWPRQAAELYRLIKMSRKAVKQIVSETLVVAARNDELVPLKAAQFIYDNVRSEKRKLLIFEKSGHVLSNDVEKEAVTDAVLAWLRS